MRQNSICSKNQYHLNSTPFPAIVIGTYEQIDFLDLEIFLFFY